MSSRNPLPHACVAAVPALAAAALKAAPRTPASDAEVLERAFQSPVCAA